MKSSEQAPDPLERLVGTTAGGKYRIERLIGRGGMGAVFLATNVAIGKRVALKFLEATAADNPDAARRFQREAEAASLVESEHIVHVFDSGVNEDGLPFLVMELLEGEDLRARLRREEKLPIADARAIATQVLRALARAHAAGIVHRDLKPDNLFLCRREDASLHVKIVDFGISKLDRATKRERLTRRGTVLGSAYYVSPEQAQASDSVDRRSDFFSLGAILFETLTGRPPHLGPTLESVLVAVCTQDAVDVRTLRTDVPEDLAHVVARALARDPDARFDDAAEFLAALTEARPSELARRRRRKNAPTIVWGIAAALVGFTLTAWLVSQRALTAAPEPQPTPASGTAVATVPAASVIAIAPLGPAPSASAPSLHASAAPASVASAPSVGNAPSTPSAGVRPAPGARPKPKSPPPNAGIARSLELSTREP